VKSNPGLPSNKLNSPQLPSTHERDVADDRSLLSARVGRRSAKWALAYLRGRSAAYIRGSVTRANVNGCVELALRYGASLDEARLVLGEHDLVWNAERRDIEREKPAPKAIAERTANERPARERTAPESTALKSTVRESTPRLPHRVDRDIQSPAVAEPAAPKPQTGPAPLRRLA
jgi:hypothetical protein